MKTRPYRIFVSPWGNVFIRELAELLAAGLTDLGRDVTVVEDGLPDPAARSVDLVVAPYDYFTLRRSFAEIDMWRAVEASVAVSTEQPGTVWLERSLPWLAASRLVLDLDTHAAGYLRSLGIPARRLHLGYHESWDRWGGDPSRARPTEVGFLGSMTDRREQFLVDAAPRWWDRACDLRLFEITTPKKGDDPGWFVGADKWDRLASTQLLVNVHRGDAPYFEWLRGLDALANGCVLLTEPSLDPDPLVPGTHVVFAPGELLADYAVGLLADPALLRRIAADAYELIRSELRMTDLLSAHLTEMESAPLGRRRTLSSFPIPDGPAPIPDAATLARQDLQRRVGFWTKRLVLGEQHGQRLIEAAGSRLTHGDPRHESTTATPGWADGGAGIGVVIPYETGDHVGLAETLEGVIAGVGVELEVIVVDDGTRDGGRTSAEVAGLMAAHPGLRLLHVRHAAARGRSGAWRSGLARVRAPWTVLLDPGTVPWPTGLARLLGTADAEDADIAWGIVVRDGPAPGVDGYLPWDVGRLCLGDTLALPVLVRTSALGRTGGPGEAMTDLGGWELWDLWLHLAATGHRGALHAGFVARTGRDPSAAAALMDLDVSMPLAHLRASYPQLPWPAHPALDAGPLPSGPPVVSDPGTPPALERALADLHDAGEERIGWLHALLSDLRRDG